MNTRFFARVFAGITFLSLMGCGYTILRDRNDEARQVEQAIADTLMIAPDLIISNVEHEFTPPRRRKGEEPWGQWDPTSFEPGKVTLYLTVKNIGNANFDNPFLLVFGNPQEISPEPLIGTLYNDGGEIIPANGEQEIQFLRYCLPSDTVSFDFTIVTNPILQHKFIDALTSHSYRPPIPPLTREFNYDNNAIEVVVPKYDPSFNRAKGE